MRIRKFLRGGSKEIDWSKITSTPLINDRDVYKAFWKKWNTPEFTNLEELVNSINNSKSLDDDNYSYIFTYHLDDTSNHVLNGDKIYGPDMTPEEASFTKPDSFMGRVSFKRIRKSSMDPPDEDEEGEEGDETGGGTWTPEPVGTPTGNGGGGQGSGGSYTPGGGGYKPGDAGNTYKTLVGGNPKSNDGSINGGLSSRWKEIFGNTADMLGSVLFTNYLAKKMKEGMLPYLKDPFEILRRVHGDLTAVLQARQRAGQIQNIASKPITSDAQSYYNQRLNAQIAANKEVVQGLLQDNLMMRDTAEKAWQQEKENKASRWQTAMDNRKEIDRIAGMRNMVDSLRKLTNANTVKDWFLKTFRNRWAADSAHDHELSTYYRDQGRYSLAVESLMKDPEFAAKYNNPNKTYEDLLYINSKMNNKLYETFTDNRSFLFDKQGGRLRFLLDGGNVDFTGYFAKYLDTEPVRSSGGRPPEASSSKKKDSLDTDDIVKLMKDADALPSDLLAIRSMLSSLNTDDILGLGTSSIAGKYVEAAAKIREAKFFRELYNDAYNHLKLNGGLNEVAVDSEGRMIVMNKSGDLKRLTALQLLSGKYSSYRPLTNANLLEIRAHDPDCAFKNQLLDVAAQGVGMLEITKYIHEAAKSLGKTSQSQEGYVQASAAGDLSGGMQFLQLAYSSISGKLQDGRLPSPEGNMTTTDGLSIPTIEGLYQVGLLSEDLTQLAMAAMNYIMLTLPDNMKTILLVKAGSAQGALDLVSNLLFALTSSKVEFKMNKKHEPAETGTKSSGSGASTIDKLKMDPVSMLLAGYADSSFARILLGSGGNNAIMLPTVSAPIVKKSGEPIGNGTLDDVSSSMFSRALDMSNVYMGDALIPFEGFSLVLIDGSALHIGYLPVDTSTGYDVVKPDLRMLERYKEAQADIISKNIDANDKEAINKIYQEHNLPIVFGPNGQLLNNYRAFGMINGTAASTAWDSETAELLTSSFVEEVIDEQEVDNVFNMLNKGKSKEDRREYDKRGFFANMGLSSDYTHVFRGTIFIPFSNNMFSGIMGSGEYPTVGQARSIEETQLAKERLSEITNAGLL